MKSALLLAFSMIAVSPAFADAGSDALLQTILKSAAYKKAQSKDLSCSGVLEVQTSKVYDALRGDRGTWKYKFVVLDCSFNPHDGGDAIREVGLAVVSPAGVVSFETSVIPQAD